MDGKIFLYFYITFNQILSFRAYIKLIFYIRWFPSDASVDARRLTCRCVLRLTNVLDLFTLLMPYSVGSTAYELPVPIPALSFVMVKILRSPELTSQIQTKYES